MHGVRVNFTGLILHAPQNQVLVDRNVLGKVHSRRYIVHSAKVLSAIDSWQDHSNVPTKCLATLQEKISLGMLIQNQHHSEFVCITLKFC